MNLYKNIAIVLALSTYMALSSGCATYKTISTAQYGDSSPIIYSGTRLNMHAITKNDYALKKFNTAPPEYPALDLPMSFALDTLILPMTVSAILTQELGL